LHSAGIVPRRIRLGSNDSSAIPLAIGAELFRAGRHGSAHRLGVARGGKSKRLNEIAVVDRPIAAGRHRDCDRQGNPEGGCMIWILVAVMVGIGLGWVAVRRRRKAGVKIA